MPRRKPTTTKPTQPSHTPPPAKRGMPKDGSPHWTQTPEGKARLKARYEALRRLQGDPLGGPGRPQDRPSRPSLPAGPPPVLWTVLRLLDATTGVLRDYLRPYGED